MISYRNSLTIILVIIIIFKIALPLLTLEIDLTSLGYSSETRRLVFLLSDLIVVGYLYYFVKRVKKQKFWLVPMVIWVLAGVYGILIPYIMKMLAIDTSGFTNVQYLTIIFLTETLDSVVRFIPEIIFGGLLLRNQAEGKIRGAIKTVGVLILVRWAIVFIIAVITTTVFRSERDSAFILRIFVIAHVLVYVAMARMYQQERKSLAKS